MAMQVEQFIEMQMDELMLGGLALLILISALQLFKVSRTNRQLTYLTNRLAGYLKAVLEDTEEEEMPQQDMEFMSRQEQDMRNALEEQRQQKKLKDAQVFDAVLSEMYP